MMIMKYLQKIWKKLNLIYKKNRLLLMQLSTIAFLILLNMVFSSLLLGFISLIIIVLIIFGILIGGDFPDRKHW